MTTWLHMIGGSDLEVEGSPTHVAQSLWGDAKPYAELEANGKLVLVNPAAVAYVDEAGTPQVHAM
jgi:hypothetical protein